MKTYQELCVEHENAVFKFNDTFRKILEHECPFENLTDEERLTLNTNFLKNATLLLELYLGNIK